jgi:hypothetical protein
MVVLQLTKLSDIIVDQLENKCADIKDTAYCWIFTLNLEAPSNEISISGAYIVVCCGICP